MVKNLLKKLIPKQLIILIKVGKLYIYDLIRFYRNSNILQKFDTEEKLKGKITIYYHVVEKGLTMPNTRLGFGEQVVTDLLDMLTLYSEKRYDKSAFEFRHAVNVVQEYIEFHKESTFALNKNIITKFQHLVRTNELDTEHTRQIEFTAEEYFKYADSEFPAFAKSRYSCRNYSAREIPMHILESCIEIAKKTPTSCNRTVNKAYIVKAPELKQEVLRLQYGNRGFGHLADTLMVLTADISVFQGVNDRNESYINTGMFAMSLLYALHHSRIAACPLNWSVDSYRDRALRKALGIPENERIGLVISCGYPPEHFKIALSPRPKTEDMITAFC